jgi:hypothetical protein
MLACVAPRVRRTVLLVTLMVVSLAQRPQVNCLPSTRVCLVAVRGSPPQHQPHLRSEVSILMYIKGNLGLHSSVLIQAAAAWDKKYLEYLPSYLCK